MSAWIVALLAGIACIAGASAWAAPAPLGGAQLRPPAFVWRENQKLHLSPGATLAPGDSVATGGGARAAFVLAGGGYLSLGADASLRVHSVDSRSGAKNILRLVLEKGVLRLDPKNGEDVRLNAGDLRVRVYGADVWIGAEAAGDTVCLLRGAVEFQYRDAGAGRLDVPGDCVFVSSNRAPLRYTPVQSILANKLAQADLGAASIASTLLPEAPLARAGTRPGAAPPVAAKSEPTGWTVVVLSLADGESAVLEAEGYRERGFDAHTFIEEVNGQRYYRVGIGRFPTREDARAFAANIKSRLHIDAAWVAAY